MFPVARAHFILATKFARSYFFNDGYIKESHLSGKGKHKIPWGENSYK